MSYKPGMSGLGSNTCRSNIQVLNLSNGENMLSHTSILSHLLM